MNQHDMKLENKTGLAHGAAFPEVPTTPKQRPDTESTRRSCPKLSPVLRNGTRCGEGCGSDKPAWSKAGEGGERQKLRPSATVLNMFPYISI